MTKWIVVHFGLIYVCNNNGPFGIEGNFPVISVFVLILISLLALREENHFQKAAYIVIFAAGVSNLYDRMIFGCVRDFINLGFFPIFNLADSVITIGVIVITYKVAKRMS